MQVYAKSRACLVSLVDRRARDVEPNSNLDAVFLAEAGHFSGDLVEGRIDRGLSPESSGTAWLLFLPRLSLGRANATAEKALVTNCCMSKSILVFLTLNGKIKKAYRYRYRYRESSRHWPYPASALSGGSNSSPRLLASTSFFLSSCKTHYTFTPFVTWILGSVWGCSLLVHHARCLSHFTFPSSMTLDQFTQ